MTTSQPTSPRSDSSGRSEWFRQSVLFWSSHNGGSEETINDDNLLNEKSAASLSSSESSLLSKNSTPAEKTSPITEEKKRGITFDPSELLRQVEELERTLNQQNSFISLPDGDDSCSTHSGITSPHLTLEFPVGSSIKNNPLYLNIDENNIDQKYGNISEDINQGTNEELSLVTNTTGKNVCINPRQRLRSEENVSSCKNDKSYSESEIQIVKNIQKVQDTLLEISKEIQCSKDKNLDRNARDPNIVLRNLLSRIKPPQPHEDERPSSVLLNSFCQSPRNDSKKCFDLKLDESLVTDLSSSQYEDTLSQDGGSCQNSARLLAKNDVLLKQLDDMIQLEHENSYWKTNTFSVVKKAVIKKPEQRERLDSGLHSTSSDSNSPYPSPVAKRASPTNQPITEITQSAPGVIYKSSKEHNDSVFCDDLSGDWSPISTLDSTCKSVTSAETRDRSYSVPRSRSNKDIPNSHTLRMSTGNMKDTLISMFPLDKNRAETMYSESELNAIRKFLTLTSQFFDKGSGGKLDSISSLEDLALLPTIKEAIDSQRKESLDQRAKQEEFLHQLGDLLLEIVTLKEEQTTVRTKQARALYLLKQQLDLHKKNQSQAHSEVLTQVNNLNEKLNNTISHSAEHLSPNLSSTSPALSPILMSPFQIPTRTYGQIIWKISDVMKKLTRVKSGLVDGTVVSQPFQTSEYGYKMNGWLYLNGRGKMTGRYLSLYVCVLVGEYDPILTWPIRPTYKFTLIDQRSDASKRQDHVRVRRVLDIAGKGANLLSQQGGIPRPTNGSKALIVGFDDFIAHEQLLERRYLADDVLFLRIEAEVV